MATEAFEIDCVETTEALVISLYFTHLTCAKIRYLAPGVTLSGILTFHSDMYLTLSAVFETTVALIGADSVIFSLSLVSRNIIS